METEKEGPGAPATPMDSADKIEVCTGSDGMPDCAVEDFSWAIDSSRKVSTGLARTDCTGVAGSTVAVHVVLEVADGDEKKVMSCKPICQYI